MSIGAKKTGMRHWEKKERRSFAWEERSLGSELKIVG